MKVALTIAFNSSDQVFPYDRTWNFGSCDFLFHSRHIIMSFTVDFHNCGENSLMAMYGM